MRKTIAILAALVVLALPLAASAAAAAKAGSWDGWITDEACGAKGAKVANAEHKDCAQKCLEKGGKLVLYNSSDKKLYQLDKQDLAKQHLGHEVTVKGMADGDKIAVDGIEAKKSAAKY
ncbi:MAG TPA: DUF5818 domain-containing protein [Thermoanaerobaculia bacterium]|nr:DUF5818 domain-containing protein [Thermoanaerobaculia bacterium]